MKNATIVAATFMLAIGTGFVVAQSNPPANRPPSTNPSTPPADTQPPANTMQPIGRQNMQPTTPPDFATLDKSGVGYVTQEQVGYDSWLRTHFAACDADHDGQVTRNEYAACTRSP
ncbi:MAG TPA: hypothetical protein VKB52_00695 [Rhodanobacteraceae bacterium]|nr:hypothetical protein [Rhodanobacteraceae bacterium]